VGQQVLLAGVGVQHHGGGHLLAERGVRDPEGDRLRHRRVAQQHLVDLPRRDLLATPVDQLLDAADQGQVAALVEHALVAGQEPAFQEGFGVGLGVGGVAVDHTGALDRHLAGRPGRQLRAGGVQHGHLDPGAHAHRAGLARGGRQRVGGDLVTGLGHPVGLQHRGVQAALDLGHQLGRQRGAARAGEAQRPGTGGPLVAGAGQHHPVDGRDRRVPGRPLLAHHRPEAERVERRGHHHGAAGGQRRQRRRQQPVHVEQRHRAQRDVLRAELVGRRDVGDRGHQVAVAQRHPLGPPGGAAGVQHERDVAAARLRRLGGREGAAGGLDPEPAVGIDRRLDEHRAIGSRRPRRRGAARRHDQRAGVHVLEVEAELGLRVGGVERGRRADRRDRQEQHDRLRTVLEHHPDRLLAPKAQPGKSLGTPPDLVAQLLVGQPRPTGHDHRRRARLPAAEHLPKHVGSS
jgi:hypothetical protein